MIEKMHWQPIINGPWFDLGQDVGRGTSRSILRDRMTLSVRRICTLDITSVILPSDEWKESHVSTCHHIVGLSKKFVILASYGSVSFVVVQLLLLSRKDTTLFYQTSYLVFHFKLAQEK